jgi:hypothetical protein
MYPWRSSMRERHWQTPWDLDRAPVLKKAAHDADERPELVCGGGLNQRGPPPGSSGGLRFPTMGPGDPIRPVPDCPFLRCRRTR